MPASNTDKFIKVAPNTGWQLDASGISDASVTSFGLISATSLPTDTAVILTIDRVNSSGVATPNLMERIVGVMSGTTVTSCVRGLEGTAQAHSAGAVVEIVISKSNINKLMEGILAEHNQDGTHKETALDSMIAGTEAQGDIIYHDGSIWNRLPKGTDGQYLKLASSIPSWASIGDWNAYTAVTPTTGTFDAPSYPIVFAGVDLTTTLYPGMRVKITQSTVKYFIITAVSFSTDTTVTLYGGTDYSLVASGTTAISAFSYSTAKAPAGFPLDPTKWTVDASFSGQSTQASPVSGTWYNIGTKTIVVPIGSWRIYVKATIADFKSGGGTNVDCFCTLSTANNSESSPNRTFTCESATTASSISYISQTGFIEDLITLASKTTLYLNEKTSQAAQTTLYIGTASTTTIVRAVSAYL